MRIVIDDARPALAARRVNIEQRGGVDVLDAILRQEIPALVGWSYSHPTGRLTLDLDESPITVPDGLDQWGAAKVVSGE